MTRKKLREAVADAILNDLLDRRGVGDELEGIRADKEVWRDIRKSIADAVLDVVREALREPTPEIIGAWWRVKNGHHFHDEPAPTDTSDYAAYRAMLAASPLRPAASAEGVG